MADLVDGYCRLQGEHKGSLIIHPKKGEFPFKGTRSQWADVAQAPRGRAEEAKPLTKMERKRLWKWDQVLAQPFLGTPWGPVLGPSLQALAEGSWGSWLLEWWCL